MSMTDDVNKNASTIGDTEESDAVQTGEADSKSESPTPVETDLAQGAQSQGYSPVSHPSSGGGSGGGLDINLPKGEGTAEGAAEGAAEGTAEGAAGDTVAGAVGEGATDALTTGIGGTVALPAAMLAGAYAYNHNKAAKAAVDKGVADTGKVSETLSKSKDYQQAVQANQGMDAMVPGGAAGAGGQSNWQGTSVARPAYPTAPQYTPGG